MKYFLIAFAVGFGWYLAETIGAVLDEVFIKPLVRKYLNRKKAAETNKKRKVGF